MTTPTSLRSCPLGLPGAALRPAEDLAALARAGG